MLNCRNYGKVTQMSDEKTKLSITFDELTEAGTASGVTPEQTEQMWNHLSAAQPAPASRSGFAQVMAYFGAAVIIVAMGTLLEWVHRTTGAQGMLIVSLLYTGIFAFSATKLNAQGGMRVPSGLLFSLAALMTPATVVALEEMTNLLQSNYSLNTLLAAAATMVVSIVFTMRARIAFVIVPALFAGAIATITLFDLAHSGGFFDRFELSLIGYGLATMVAAFAMDRRSTEDYSFWAYGVAALSLWLGLTMLDKGQFGYLIYAVGGAGSMFISVLLGRRIFAITGGFAVLAWITHLMYTVFGGSVAFPVLLTVLGGVSVAVSVFYARNSKRIESAALRMVPKDLRRGLPRDDDK